MNSEQQVAITCPVCHQWVIVRSEVTYSVKKRPNLLTITAKQSSVDHTCRKVQIDRPMEHT